MPEAPKPQKKVAKKAPVSVRKEVSESTTSPLPPPPLSKFEPPPLVVGEEIVEGMSDEELVVAFRNLRKRLDDEKKYRRTTTYALGLACLLAIFLGGAVFLIQMGRNHDRVIQSRNACVLGNDFRSQIRELGVTLNTRADNSVNTLIAASEFTNRDKVQTPEEKARTEAGIKEFKRLSDIDSQKVKDAISSIKDLDCAKLYH